MFTHFILVVAITENDNNCFQGEPFAAMPRLRVLSMKNNRMSSIPETTFRSLRGNIAVMDFDGSFIAFYDFKHDSY